MNLNKLRGGRITTTATKIPADSTFFLRFEPDFDSPPTPKMIEDLVEKLRVRASYFRLSEGTWSDELTTGDWIKSNVIGNEIFFFLNASEGGNISNIAPSRPFSMTIGLVKSEEEDDFEKVLSKEVFQIDDSRFFSEGSNFTSNGNNEAIAIKDLPESLNNLKDLNVSLQRTPRDEEADRVLWRVIKNTTDAISFNNYKEFMDRICSGNLTDAIRDDLDQIRDLGNRRFLPFNDTDSYRTMKVLTEAFLLINCGVNLADRAQLQDYLEEVDGIKTLPYLKIIRNKLSDVSIKLNSIGDILDIIRSGAEDVPNGNNCYGILTRKLSSPCFLELIWSYWHEESMLVQAMNAITRRFQNVKAPGRDPLAGVEIGPLRPLNNLLWGYVQDEQHRLTIKRRAYEYDHHYGISLVGKAIPTMHTADSRTNFMAAFHNLLFLCTQFYKQEDDTTVIADAFPLLSALREVHLILSEGAHNQYGDMPFTARMEMLMQQWLLSRPEFDKFLPTRTMVAYPEPWMGPLAVMNNMQGWTSTSPVQFNQLAIYGEQLLLAIRFGNWADPKIEADQAAIWALDFRPQIQGYIHAYRSVTGVDLTNPNPRTGKIDDKAPSFHLLKRLNNNRLAS